MIRMVNGALSRRGLLAAPLGLSLAACMPAPARPTTPPGACAPAADYDITGFDAARLNAALDAFMADPADFHQLVIERDGKLVAERYRRGEDKPLDTGASALVTFDACTLHDLRSISKSVTSLLWGIAEGMGKTPPLTTPALSLYPELADLATGGREHVTLAHLLSMSSGLEWDETNYGGLQNPETQLYWNASQPRATFSHPLVAAPGARFNYCGGNTAIIADLLARFTGVSLTAFAQETLFAPLGISNWTWSRDYRRRPLAFAGLRLAPRDLIRIGRMVCDGGRWGDQQIVPEAWIAESTAPHVEVGDGLHYGYFWWLGATGGHDYIAGFGNGGQRLFIAPTLDLSVAITAGEYSRPGQGRVRGVFEAIIAAASSA